MAPISPVTQQFILHWGEMSSRWGINRTVAQIHALLYLSPEPLNAEQIAGALSVARSNVSTSLRELQAWGIVRVVHLLGDRRDHFETMEDAWQMFQVILEQRKRREIDPTVATLTELVAEAGTERRGELSTPQDGRVAAAARDVDPVVRADGQAAAKGAEEGPQDGQQDPEAGRMSRVAAAWAEPPAQSRRTQSRRRRRRRPRSSRDLGEVCARQGVAGLAARLRGSAAVDRRGPRVARGRAGPPAPRALGGAQERSPPAGPGRQAPAADLRGAGRPAGDRLRRGGARLRGGGGADPQRLAAARRRHRSGSAPPRGEDGARHLRQRRLGRRRQLAAGDGTRAGPPHGAAGHHAPDARDHRRDDRRRGGPARQPGPPQQLAGRLLPGDPGQDGGAVPLGAVQRRRGRRPLVARLSSLSRATARISAWRSSWSTTCSTTPARRS